MENGNDRDSAATPCSLTCPECGSNNISGLMASFWVKLDPDGETMAGNWNDYESATEIGPERMCSDCGEEF